MLIVGAKGFAKEVLEVLHQMDQMEDVVFFDDVSENLPSLLFDKFRILKTNEEVLNYFKAVSTNFTLGLGGPFLRFKLYKKMIELGGVLQSTISPYAHIGHFGVRIDPGCNIMTGVVMTNDIQLGKGCLINLNCTIGHDCVIGDFTEMSPGVAISGGCEIGSFCNLGTNATLLPKIKLGQNVIIGAGAVVNQDIPDNCLAVGVPAKVIKQLPPLEI